MTGDFLERLNDYRRVVYCSHHTTAGFLEQSLCSRLGHNEERVSGFIGAFQRVFPPQADYQHDQIHLREDLTDLQRETEPRNADSHLTYISSGLNSCVSYIHHPNMPVYLIDLDGVHEHGVRNRKTTVIGYDREETVSEFSLSVPVSHHSIDSINLRESGSGLFERVQEEIQRHGVTAGRIQLDLESDEAHAGLTVNEYETLLMRHDLAEILRNPLRFAVQKGKSALRDPRSIPNKTINYAQYDLVRVMNELMDSLGVNEPLLERLFARFVAAPASRFLRMQRSVNLMISDQHSPGEGTIVQGTYQSPILVQWHQAERQARQLHVRVHAFS